MIRYVTELIGTFFLVLTIGLVVVQATPLGPIAIGAVLMVMVYMGGHVSGGHYNPAVSLAAVLAGKLETRELVPYWAAQLVGAVAGALAARAIVGDTFAPAPSPEASPAGFWLAEALFTFALCLVVLNSATHPKTKGNSFYGLAIGFTVGAGAIAVGPVSGAAFNPAVGVGPTLVHAALGAGTLAHVPLYVAAPILGGALAALVFHSQEKA
jgi:aquaporin Z